MEFLVLFFLILNSIFILFFKKISSIFNIFDYPDFKRKVHKKKISLSGGTLVFVNFLILIILDLYLDSLNFFNFEYIRNIFIFVLSSCLIYFIGFLDDKYDLKPNSKLISIFTILFCLCLVDQDMVINSLNIEMYNKKIYLGNFDIFFTVLCILLLINAFNMIDGINLQATFFSLFIFANLIFLQSYVYLSFMMILFLIFFLYLNVKNLSFLGNNGSLFLGFLISYLLIKTYNLGEKLYSVENVLFLLIIPGLDMIRVTMMRIISGKHIFHADKSHLHHLMISKFNLIKTNLIFLVLILLPVILFNLKVNSLLILIIITLLYFLIIIFLKKTI